MTFRPFWLDQALRSEHAAPCPPLAGDTRADVCIVGGGYTGLWTAIMLKEHDPGLDVVLVEADLCGAGASGRNGGCALSWSAKFFTLERLFGLTEAIRLVKASEDSIRAIGAFCQRYDVEADYRLDGTLYTATNPAQVGSTDSVIAALERHGINSFAKRPLADVQRLAGSRRHLEGWFSPAAATVQPGKLVRGLRRVALQLGVRLYEGTPMRGLEHGRPAEVVTPHGRVVAGRVVLALNAWMARAFPQFERSVAIVSSDMLITEPRPDLLQEIGLTSGVSVLDSRIFVHYYHNTPDGRLMLGKGGNTFAYGGRMLPVFDRPSPYLGQLRGSLGVLPRVRRGRHRGQLERSVGSLGDRPAVLRPARRPRQCVLRLRLLRQRRRSMPHGRADPFFAGARPGQSLDPFAADPGAARPLPAGADPLCRFADGAQRDPSQGARRRRRPAPASSRRTPGQVRRRRGQGRQGLSRFPGVSSAHSGAPFFFLRFRFRSSKGRKKRI